MPDLSSASDVVERYPRQEFTWAHAEAAWQIALTVGALVVIVLAIVAFILYAFRFLESWRNTPPPPTSIIPEQPDRRRQ